MASYQITWLLEDKVVLFQLEGAYDLEVMRQAMIALDDALVHAAPQVYLVIDAEKLADFARNFREMIDELQKCQNYHKFIWSLLITNNLIVRFFGSIASNLFKVKFRSVASVDEAIEVLIRIDPTLHPLHQRDLYT